mmetsp:Transcript_4001/g.7665  ORF Transcript_4001/g.7665 Transcript_4001/m.7665 type:complete len:189 (-) Transcript_4001:42-608(-)
MKQLMRQHNACANQRQQQQLYDKQASQRKETNQQAARADRGSRGLQLRDCLLEYALARSADGRHLLRLTNDRNTIEDYVSFSLARSNQTRLMLLAQLVVMGKQLKIENMPLLRGMIRAEKAFQRAMVLKSIPRELGKTLDNLILSNDELEAVPKVMKIGDLKALQQLHLDAPQLETLEPLQDLEMHPV